MCGITGFWDTSKIVKSEILTHRISKMSQQLYHRGPDDGGNWVDENHFIALGHRRLSIVDLSPEGHQPMISADGRYVIVFNGEIYNFQLIREDLLKLGHKFRGNSDTEVMLASFCQWGIHASVTKFIGMFAFAVWDKQEQQLHLGRDRLGEKPLYYGWLGQNFVFASELKALKLHPQWQGQINRDSLSLFLHYNYIPAPHSIYQNIYKLLPGTLLTLSAPYLKPEPIAYWSMESLVKSGLENPFRGTNTEAVKILDKLLREVISQQMIADVSLGAFLSGGIDSSTVVALMQVQSSQPVKTFSIGFPEPAYNEAEYAKAVANHLGTDHTELYVTSQEAMKVIPKLPTLYDEPFADFSQIPTFIVSHLARQKVTVSLSGDGGDELFYGYNRYFQTNNIWQKTGWIPLEIRKFITKSLTTLPVSTWNKMGSKLQPFLSSQFPLQLLGDKIHKLAGVIAVPNQLALYQKLISHWQNLDSLVIGGKQSVNELQQHPSLNLSNFREQMMYTDSISYLPDDILAKVDRAAMGVSLETRVPFLDHRIVELAWQLPINYKVKGNKGKWILKQLLYKYIPRELIERPKKGFGVPMDKWLRLELRDWAESLLDKKKLKEQGFLNYQPIKQKWREHLSGNNNWQYLLWDVLAFQMFLENSQK